MKILFYEPTHTGHHYPYLARMLPAFVELPAELVLATTEEGHGSPEFEKHLEAFANDMTILTACAPSPGGSPVATAKFRMHEVMNLSKQLKPDHLMILYADGLWQCLATRALTLRPTFEPSVTVEGILYRGGFSYPDATGRSDRLKRWLFRRLLRSGPFARLMLDDEYLYDFAASAQPAPPRTRVTLAANPVMLKPMQSRSSARGALGLPTDGRVISLSGSIDTRKGTDLLVKAFIHALGQGLADARLLVAGPHTEEIRALLRSAGVAEHVASGRIVSLDRLLVGDEMFLVAAASDLVTAPYPNHSGRSSIILWAAAAGRPVVAADRGCIARVVESERLGVTCNVKDKPGFASALTRSIDSPWTDEDVARSRRYAAFHDVSNYQRINAELARERLGMASR